MSETADTAARLDKIARESGERMLKFFAFKHLPVGPLQDTSARFARLACDIVEDVTSTAERTAGLRKLLEAKDCIVRAKLEV